MPEEHKIGLPDCTKVMINKILETYEETEPIKITTKVQDEEIIKSLVIRKAAKNYLHNQEKSATKLLKICKNIIAGTKKQALRYCNSYVTEELEG